MRRVAQFIMSQYGGPDGEMGASMRYLSQRYSMPYGEQKAVLTTLVQRNWHTLRIVAAIVHQLTRNPNSRGTGRTGIWSVLYRPCYRDLASGGWRCAL